MIGRDVVWCTSPGFGKRAILQTFCIWIESTATGGNLFVIPRILQCEFGRVSKFIHIYGQYTDLALSLDPLVPFILFSISPYNRHNMFRLSQEERTVDAPPPLNPVLD